MRLGRSFCFSLGFCSLFTFTTSGKADDLYVTDASEMPGKLYRSSNGNPVIPNAISLSKA